MKNLRNPFLALCLHYLVLLSGTNSFCVLFIIYLFWLPVSAVLALLIIW